MPYMVILVFTVKFWACGDLRVWLIRTLCQIFTSEIWKDVFWMDPTLLLSFEISSEVWIFVFSVYLAG